MDVNLPERSRIVLAVGVLCLVAGVGLLYIGFPTYTTTITEQEPSEEAMAATVDSYAESEIDSVPVTALSPAEQTAVTRASQSPQLTYTDYGASDRGSYFEYRNDIANHYFVTYNESVYLVRVVVAMNPLAMAAGVLSGVVGVALILGGVWQSYLRN